MQQYLWQFGWTERYGVIGMREKLIELLSGFSIDTAEDVEFVAEYLIANGVTIPVRCKDCKYWCEDILSCTIGNNYDDNWYAEDFCSYGKKNANADPEGEIDFDYNAED